MTVEQGAEAHDLAAELREPIESSQPQWPLTSDNISICKLLREGES